MKVDLAIYSHTVDASGQCMSESLILGHNFDFSSCDILVDFCKSSHILYGNKKIGEDECRNIFRANVVE